VGQAEIKTLNLVNPEAKAIASTRAWHPQK